MFLLSPYCFYCPFDFVYNIIVIVISSAALIFTLLRILHMDGIPNASLLSFLSFLI